MIDLHMHSTESDGEDNSFELIKKAKANGVSIMSITDHDVVSAYKHAVSYAKRSGIQLIPGIELNTSSEDGEFHILGYGIDVEAEALRKHTEWRKQDRVEWNQLLVHRLQSLGYAITWSDVLAEATGEIIVRTHIAAALVRKAYFRDARAAYQNLLIKGKPAYQPRSQFSAEEAIALIHRCGGQAFLAHPGTYLEPIPLTTLVRAGLDGIEAYHSLHSPAEASYWHQTASALGLRISGGSDYHGTHSKNPFPIGSVHLPEGIVAEWEREMEVSQ